MTARCCAPLAAQRLLQMMADDSLPATVQLQATVKVLEFGLRRGDVDDIQARIEELRQVLGSQTTARKGLRAV